jgi:hypothetical protein
MTTLDSALLESVAKDYFDDVRVLALVDLFRSAQSDQPVGWLCVRSSNNSRFALTTEQFDELGWGNISTEPFKRVAPLYTAPRSPAEPQERFVVRHYSSDKFPTIKGNGFDGLQVGEDREEAEQFVAWINARMAPPQRPAPIRNQDAMAHQEVG